VLGPVDAKGLEFDDVIVVEPAALVATDRRGLRLLYVTLTRATQRLTVVHATPLPEALRANQSSDADARFQPTQSTMVPPTSR
jgi:ATP-dependent exoDNAse (exonuclease V) beta subunit